MIRIILGLGWLLYSCQTSWAEYDFLSNSNEIETANENEGDLKNSSLVGYYEFEHLLADIERNLKVINMELKYQRQSNELLSTIVSDVNSKLNTLLTTKSEADSDQAKLKKLESCDEALKDANAKDGVYQISIPDQTLIEPFYVYCMRDPESNKAWTIIQRRMNGNINFYRKWHEYKIGFGHLLGEHWLGLEKIHALTNSKPHKLWIKLMDFEDATHNANYEQFSIGNEDSKYALNILGTFSGSAGDSLSYHAGHKFSTRDSQNDFSTDGSCAQDRKGAWWFNSCAESHLNGEYFKGSLNSNSYGLGVTWYAWHGRYYSLKYVHMAIRPVD